MKKYVEYSKKERGRNICFWVVFICLQIVKMFQLLKGVKVN